MLIKSPFKDYYDFIAHQYGGGDPKIVYNRNRLKTEIIKPNEIQKFVFIEGDMIDRSVSPAISISLSQNFILKYLVVAGKFYLVVITRNEDFSQKFEILNPEHHPEITESLKRSTSMFNHKRSTGSIMEYYVGCEDPDLIKVSREIGAPVFMIDGTQYRHERKGWMISINPNIPVLGSIEGFPAIYPPEQLYQDLAYFISNKMCESPDLAPPATVSNKDRIVQYGFDLKTSFRHAKGK